MKKTSIILIIIVVVGAFIYFYLNGNSNNNSALLQGSSPELSDNISMEVLALLNQIQSLKIDSAMFSEPVYRTLVDYSVPIPPQDIGRTNPFAPTR